MPSSSIDITDERVDPLNQLKFFERGLYSAGLGDDCVRVAMAVAEQLDPKGAVPPYGPIADRKHQIRNKYDDRAVQGQIPGCATSGCGGICCQVGPDAPNMITMPKSEWTLANVGSSRMDHLLCRDEEPARFLVACLNGIKSCSGCGPSAEGSSGYVPIDCSVYPFFFDFDENKLLRSWVATRGGPGEKVKCLLPATDALLHLPWALTLVTKVVNEKPEFSPGFVDSIRRMVGYTALDLSPFVKLDSSEVRIMMQVAADSSLERTISVALRHAQVSSVAALSCDNREKLNWAEKAIICKKDQAWNLVDQFLLEISKLS